jgi:phosphate starvation-inducible protein PhoH
MSQNLSHQEIADIEYYIEKRNRKEKRKARKPQHSGLVMQEVEPLTNTQSEVFQSYNMGNNLVLKGCAGTGKTFLSTYLAVRDVMEKVEGKRQVIIVRSVVPVRDMGFLPGNITEKMKSYETPYRDLLSGMFNRGDSYDMLKTKGVIHFETTSFVRGLTWDDAIIIVDEAQNLSFQELHSVITRVGENSRIIFSGDTKQDDLTSERFKEESGLSQFLKILDKMESFDVINFKTEDIVRSGLVREYIEVCESLNTNNLN